jgi:hypothetical protein
VEAIPDNATSWRRSSFCMSGECVEIRIDTDSVHVRDSKDPVSRGAILTYSRTEWDAFICGAKRGEFDLEG